MSLSEDQLKEKTNEIRKALSDLGLKLKAGDESQLLVWVLPNSLACAHRPLRHHPKFGGSGCDLSADATPLVINWADRIKTAGIRAIICLMHEKELNHYNALCLGTKSLIDFYRKEGLEVRHIPWEDPAHLQQLRPSTFHGELGRVREEAWKAFQNLPKPILLHCSAGIDRSSPVAAHIWHLHSKA